MTHDALIPPRRVAIPVATPRAIHADRSSVFASGGGHWFLSRVVGLAFCVFAMLASPAVAQQRKAPSPGRAPQLWAVVIGIDRYEDKAIAECRTASSDARAVRRWLTEKGGWSPRNVLFMDSASARQHGDASQPLNDLYPHRSNLTWALREWLSARVRPNDVVLVYFAGQAGTAMVPSGAQGTRDARGVLLPIDAKANDYAVTGWALEDAIEPLAAKGQNPILLLLDTSLSGRGKTSMPADEPVPSSNRWLNMLSRWPSVCTWLAADGHAAAEGATPQERGPFVAAMLGHLGDAARPANLVDCLNRLSRVDALKRQGFRTAGGLSPDLSLWAKQLAVSTPPSAQLFLQHGHANRVFDVAVSADGQQVISAGADSTARVWRVADRMLLRSLTYHMVGVTKIALSPDGKHLATGDGAGQILVWSLPDYRPVLMRGAQPHRSEVAAIEFLADATHFVSLDAEGKSALWTLGDKRDVAAQPLAGQANAVAAGDGRIAVAFLDDTGASRIQLFRADGQKLMTLPGPGGAVVTRGLALDGEFLAVGDRAGQVVLWDLAKNADVAHHDLGAAVGALRVFPDLLVIGAGSDVVLAPFDRDREVVKISLDDRVEQCVLSRDGTRLAVTTARGGYRAWEIVDRAHPREIKLVAERPCIATSVAFPPDGRQLIVGGQTGEIRAWDLPGGTERPEIAPHRGQIAALAASGDGRAMLLITKDREARVWDLEAGRSLHEIPGSWTSGVARPNSSAWVMTDAQGDVHLVDQTTGTRTPTVFQRPPAEDGSGESQWTFGLVAASPDGKWVAAAVPDAPLACIWDAATGALRRTIRDHDAGISALQFSADSRRVLTGSLDGTVKLWSVDPDADGALSKPAVADGERPVTAASMIVTEVERIAVGYDDGQVFLKDGPRWSRLGRLDGAVHAFAFSDDGRWLAAAGDDKFVRLWSLAGAEPRMLRLDPAHAERVNALIAWPGGKLFASGSEDTTIRFWRIADAKLLGTLSAVSSTGDWVAFTPDGQFDSSPGAERQVTWARDGQVFPLEQFGTRLRVFRLTDRLRNAELPPVRFTYRSANPPPALAIEPVDPAASERQVELSIALGESKLENLRVYQNGIPVGDAADLVRLEGNGERRARLKATLRHGVNAFYVMASRPGGDSIEGRSNAVEIRYDGPDVPGKLHILALGVNAYPNRPLKFSARDAEAVAGYLRDHGVASEVDRNLIRVLENTDVTEENVRRELAAMRLAAKPEDTVVVFLAGHADVRKDRGGRDRFCLLLPTFPFEPASSGIALAARGADAAPSGEDPPKSVLPYASIAQYLVRMPALQRLVIVDACQAEAARDDPTALRYQERAAEKIDDDAHMARTSYILASRRNEAALESDELKHGLLTYLLLRGMGSSDLARGPVALPANADRDGNGIVTTEELRRYVAVGLPPLAARLDPSGRRAGPDPTSGVAPGASAAPPVRLQAADDHAIPLVRVPKPN